MESLIKTDSYIIPISPKIEGSLEKRGKKEGNSHGNWKSSKKQRFLDTKGQIHYIYACIFIYIYICTSDNVSTYNTCTNSRQTKFQYEGRQPENTSTTFKLLAIDSILEKKM